MRISREGIVASVAAVIALVGVSALFSAAVYSYPIDSNRNLLLCLQDGMEDDGITEYYAYDIEQVYNITNSTIRIGYIDVDLNEDRWMDKIVIVQSSYHTGSHGDTFDILVNKGDTYESVFDAVFKMCAHDKELTPYGEIHILENRQGKFHDIRVVTEGNEWILRYSSENGRYDMI